MMRAVLRPPTLASKLWTKSQKMRMAEPDSGKQTLDEVVEGAAEAEVSTERSAATPSIQQQVAESAPVPLWLAALRKEWEITGVHTSIVKIESDQFDAATPRSITVTILPMS
jgi:hypothetical protein